MRKSGVQGGGKRKHIRIESASDKALEISRSRLLTVLLVMIICFMAVGVRVVEIVSNDAKTRQAGRARAETSARADILDRNGVTLATTLTTYSLYVNPSELRNVQETARELKRIWPATTEKEWKEKLSAKKKFVWLKRNLTPKEQRAVNDLGIPALHFIREAKRVYPQGSLLAHVLGFVGVDNHGLAGIEKSMDKRLSEEEENRTAITPLRLSLDVRIQQLLHDSLTQAVEEFRAQGAMGVLADVNSGEVLGLVSLPDFDPHHPGKASDNAKFNRAIEGVYEMGSTFKSFTMATALDTRVAGFRDGYDASHPLKVASFTISDTHPQNRWLSLPEIYMHSSNIGSARMAMDIGKDRQKAYLKRLGLLDPLVTELPEKPRPLYPSDWKPLNTMTIGFGHGISVSPLHLVRATGALINGGYLTNLTFVKPKPGTKQERTQVVGPETSIAMRELMRLVVEKGTASKADVPGYMVGGKTGTAEKVGGGGYNQSALLSSFICGFPINNPKYILLVMLDEPKGNAATYGYATGGWTAAPTAAKVIAQMAAVLGLPPLNENKPEFRRKFWTNKVFGNPELAAN